MKICKTISCLLLTLILSGTFNGVSAALASKKKSAAQYERLYRKDKMLLQGNIDAITVMFKAKKYKPSCRLAEEYLEYKPNDVQIRTIQVKCYEQMKENDSKLRKAMTALLELDTTAVEWCFKLAGLDLAAGDTSRAIANAKRWLTKNPKSLKGYRFISPLISDRFNERAYYLHTLEKIISLSPKSSSKAARKLGILKYNNQQYKEAEKLLKKAVKKFPGDPEIWYTLGKIRTQSKTKGSGAKELKKAWKLAPEEIKYARAVGEYLKKDSELKQNLETLKFLNRHSPNIAEQQKLARSYFLNKEYGPAADIWIKFSEMDEKLVDTAAAWSFLKSKKVEHALSFSNLMVQNYDYNLDLAHLLDSTGRKHEAVLFYEAALEINPKGKEVLRKLSEAYSSRGETDKSLDAHRKLLIEKPLDKKLQAEYMELIAASGDREKLKTACVFIKTGDPKSHLARYKLARIYIEEKKISQAYKLMKAAYRLQPADSQYQKLLLKTIRGDQEILTHFQLIKKMSAERKGDIQANLLCAKGHTLKKQYKLAASRYERVYNSDKKVLYGDSSAIIILRKAGKCLPAIDLARHYLIQNPNNRTIREIHVKCGQETGMEQYTLRNSMKALAKLHSKSGTWWFKLAELDLAAGDTSSAVKHGKLWLEKHPGSLKGSKFVNSLIKNNPAEKKYFAKLLKTLIKLDPGKAGSRKLTLGLLLIEMKDYKGAKRVLKPLAASRKFNEKAVFGMYKIHEAEDNKTSARRALFKLVKKKPGNKEYVYLLALINAELNDYSNVIKLLTGDGIKAGLDSDMSFLLLDSYIKRKEFEKAEEHGNKLLKKFPVESKSSLELAYLLFKRKKTSPAKKILDNILVSNPSPKAYYLRACIALNDKDWERSIEYFKKSRDFSPKSDKFLALAFKETGDYKNSLESLKKFYLHAPQPSLLPKLYFLHKKQNDTAGMIKVLDELITAYPEKKRFRHGLADIYISQGDGEKARLILKGLTADTKSAPRAYFQLSRISMLNNNFKSSEKHLLKAIELEPGNPEFFSALGDLCYSQGKFSQSAKIYARISSELSEKHHIQYADALMNTGLINKSFAEYRDLQEKSYSLKAASIVSDLYVEKGMVQEAENIINNVSSAGNLDIDISRIKIQIARGDVSGALKSTRPLLKANPNNGQLHILQGICYHKKAKFRLAEKTYLKALNDPKYRQEALYQMGINHLKDGQLEKAAASFNKMNRSSKLWRSRAHLGLAMVNIRMKNYSTARKQLLKSIKLTRTIKAAYLLTIMALNENNLENAKKWAMRTKSLDEKDPRAETGRAEVLSALGRNDRALALLAPYEEENPESCDLLLTIAKISLDEGRAASAISKSKKAAFLCPEKEEGYFYQAMAARGLKETRLAAKYFKLYKKHGGDESLIPDK